MFVIQGPVTGGILLVCGGRTRYRQHGCLYGADYSEMQVTKSVLEYGVHIMLDTVHRLT
jgi:hypothetical protein